MVSAVPFGRYLLFDKLASGGMAEVFLARVVGEAGFQRPCAIKRVLPHLAELSEFVQMFLDEARIVARLSHPGIVQVFDLGQHEGDYFCAMELLVGEDLERVLQACEQRRRAVPPEIAARVIADAAEALHYAHEFKDDSGSSLGIIHRDVSPSNVFLTYQGAVKVLDFGLARAARRAELTFAGQIRGKVSYLAPEQLEKRPVDRRADVWALGVCLHELLTGRRLFTGTGALDVARAVATAPILAPSSIRKDIPPALDQVVLRALRRDPNERYETAAAFQRALQGFLQERTYVPQGALGEYLLDLFGRERIETKRELARQAGDTDPSGRGPQTVDLGSVRSPSLPAITQLELVRPRRRALPVVAAGVGLAAVVAVFAGSSRRAPTRVSIPAPAVPQPTVAPPVPAVATVVDPPDEPPEEPPSSRPKRTEGFLTLTSNVPATAFEGRTKLGALPLQRLRLHPGHHVVRLENPTLGLRHEQTVDIGPGQSVTRRIAVEKGRLNVLVTPWAKVSLDGRDLGATPLAGVEVWEGPHRVRLSSPAGEKTVTVLVRGGETAMLKETLP